MVEERAEHGGDSHGERGPLRLQQIEERAGLECAEHHVGGPLLSDLERHALATDVEEGKRIHVHVALADPEPYRRHPRRIGEATVCQASALRRPRGAGRVDDLGDVVGRDLGERTAGSRASIGSEERVPVVEEHVLPQCRQPRARALQLGDHVTSPVLALEEDSSRSGGGQHVARFGRAERRIDRHEDETRQCGREGEHERLRARRRPDRDPLARLEPPPGRAPRVRQDRRARRRSIASALRAGRRRRRARRRRETPRRRPAGSRRLWCPVGT